MFLIPHFVILILSFFCEPVQAFDGGDVTALVLGLMIGILGICACLGAYARRRNANA